MNERQRIFVAEYLVDFKGEKAAIAAGYSASRAKVTSCELLRNPLVAAAIEAGIREKEKRAALNADMVIAELGAIAFANIHDFMRIEDGHAVYDLSKVANDRAKFAGVEIHEEIIDSGHRKGRRTIVKLKEKTRALELLAKHFGVLVNRSTVEHTGTIEIQNAARNLESRLMEAASSVGAAENPRRVH
jgi:phage terminase small subunit